MRQHGRSDSQAAPRRWWCQDTPRDLGCQFGKVKERAGDRLTGSAHAARRDLEGHANHIAQRCVRFKAAFASHFIKGYAARLSRDIRQTDDASIFEPGSSSSLPSPSPSPIFKIDKQIRPRAHYTIYSRGERANPDLHCVHGQFRQWCGHQLSF